MEQNLNYQNLPVRIITDENEQTWFTAIDICNILEYANPTQALDKLDEDEKKLDSVFHSSGQKRKTWNINESGLYSLILNSSKPEAKRFKKWITNEVLPSIRKAGKYTTEEIKEHELNIQTLAKKVKEFEARESALKADLAGTRKELAASKMEMFSAITEDRNQLKIPFNQ